MNQETLVRPERFVKVMMALAVLSLLTIAVCLVVMVSRGNPPILRRPVLPMMENRTAMMRNEAPPMIPGMAPQGSPGEQGGAGRMNRPGQGNQPGQPPEKPAKQ